MTSPGGEPAARGEQVGERAAVGEVENEHDGVGGRHDAMQPDQMGMVERGEQRAPRAARGGAAVGAAMRCA